jgi:RNA polymerase sigma-70 factor (ECF subfamily)
VSVQQPEYPGGESRVHRGPSESARALTSVEQHEDRQLIARIVSGDRQAYMDLYDRYSPRVFGVIAAVLGRGGEADDAFQEAMWEVWRCADRYNERLGTPSMWILTLARNKAIDALRRSTRKRALAQRAAAERPEARSASPSESLAQRESLGSFASLLATLPAEQGDVIRAAYLEGQTREDIAAARDIPVGTVKTRIRSGIQSLARMLEKGVAAQGSPS